MPGGPNHRQGRRPSRRRFLGLIAGVTAVLLIAVAAAVVITVRTRQAPDLPTGDLPAVAVPTTPAVKQVAASAELSCYREMARPWQITGCYRTEPGRIVQGRFKIGTDGRIDKFQLQILDDQ